MITDILTQRCSEQQIGKVWLCYGRGVHNYIVSSSVAARSKGPFQEAFVYVVGGGNYIEYQNLQDYCKRQQNVKTITYGTSELMNAREFLSQVCAFVCATRYAVIGCCCFFFPCSYQNLALALPSEN